VLVASAGSTLSPRHALLLLLLPLLLSGLPPLLLLVNLAALSGNLTT
jgi:hypothetical protein